MIEFIVLLVRKGGFDLRYALEMGYSLDEWRVMEAWDNSCADLYDEGTY